MGTSAPPAHEQVGTSAPPPTPVRGAGMLYPTQPRLEGQPCPRPLLQRERRWSDRHASRQTEGGLAWAAQCPTEGRAEAPAPRTSECDLPRKQGDADVNYLR